MKPIPTKVHGLLDYSTSALFIASPWLLGFASNNAARRVAVGTGVAGLAKRIPMSTHLTVDTVNGIVVATSPWLFGLLELGAGLLTQRNRPIKNEFTRR